MFNASILKTRGHIDKRMYSHHFEKTTFRQQNSSWTANWKWDMKIGAKCCNANKVWYKQKILSKFAKSKLWVKNGMLSVLFAVGHLSNRQRVKN